MGARPSIRELARFRTRGSSIACGLPTPQATGSKRTRAHTAGSRPSRTGSARPVRNAHGLVVSQTIQAGMAPVRLSEVIEARRPQILARWESAVRRLHPADDLSEPALLNCVPQLLDRIAEAVKSAHPVGDGSLEKLQESHALARLEEGFDLEVVTAEFALLRRTIADVWREEVGNLVPMEQVARLNRVIDEALAISVSRFAASRERTLKALDRISAAAPSTGDLDTFLPKLIQVLQETNEAVDAVVILLREGEWLRVRGFVGMAGEREMFELRVGEPFAGKIASECHPSTLRVGDGAVSCREHQALLRNGIKLLYGVPLVHDGEIIGVTHMGSRTAPDFSEEDKQLFRVMAERATSLIVQAELVVRERETRREVQNALALLDTLLAASPVGIAFVDRDLRYVRINEALAAVNGKPVAEHLGRTVREVLSAAADFMEPLLRNIIEKGEPLVGMELASAPPSTPSEVRHWLAYWYPVRSHAEEILGVGGLVFEITDRKRAEEELKRTAVFREQFLGMVGHDLRNPLNAIRVTASHLLKETRGRDPYARMAARILKASDRMVRMLDELSDLVRGRLGGGIAVQVEEADMQEIARVVVDEHRASHSDRRIDLHVEGATDGRWDPTRVAQVISNLLANALKHGQADAPVTVSLEGGRADVLLKVHNWGTPIPAEMRQPLFEPFRRGRKATGEGLGLGLYIVDQIVRAHGGAIEVRSTAPEGTRFIVRWPRVPPEKRSR